MTGAVARVSLGFAVAGAVAVGVVLGYNRFKAGHPLRFGYASDHGAFTLATWWDAVWGATIGPDRGIVWQNLWLLPAVLLVILGWRRLGPDLRLAVGLGAVLFLTSVAFYSFWIGWAGGLHTYGTRFQQHVVPLLALGLILGACQAARRIRAVTPRPAVAGALLAAALQLPSIMFVHNLEALQAMVSGATVPPGNVATAAMGGQLRLRHANVYSKLTTGTPVPLDTLSREPPLLRLLDVSSRWDFWAWRLGGYAGPGAVQAAKLLWAALLLCSIGAWSIVFRRAAEDHDAR